MPSTFFGIAMLVNALLPVLLPVIPYPATTESNDSPITFPPLTRSFESHPIVQHLMPLPDKAINIRFRLNCQIVVNHQY